MNGIISGANSLLWSVNILNRDNEQTPDNPVIDLLQRLALILVFGDCKQAFYISQALSPHPCLMQTVKFGSDKTQVVLDNPRADP